MDIENFNLDDSSKDQLDSFFEYVFTDAVINFNMNLYGQNCNITVRKQENSVRIVAKNNLNYRTGFTIFKNFTGTYTTYDLNISLDRSKVAFLRQDLSRILIVAEQNYPQQAGDAEA